MTRQVWRIVQGRWAATAFSGEGARLYGGRWNSAGRALVYTAEHSALAAVEMLVHLQAEQLLKIAYVLIDATFDDGLVDTIPPEKLPPDWDADPAPASAQLVGDDWLATSSSQPVLRVPSAVIPNGWNYLLNPLHARFAEIKFGKPQPFKFDPRLKK